MRSNEKFTQRAEYAIEKAGAAAGNMGHSYVGTEHLLMGILREPESTAARNSNTALTWASGYRR